MFICTCLHAFLSSWWNSVILLLYHCSTFYCFNACILIINLIHNYYFKGGMGMAITKYQYVIMYGFKFLKSIYEMWAVVKKLTLSCNIELRAKLDFIIRSKIKMDPKILFEPLWENVWKSECNHLAYKLTGLTCFTKQITNTPRQSDPLTEQHIKYKDITLHSPQLTFNRQ